MRGQIFAPTIKVGKNFAFISSKAYYTVCLSIMAIVKKKNAKPIGPVNN
jgi:hypothetical protein